MSEISKKNVRSVGVGLTSICNLRCPHCYSRNLDQGTMNLADIKDIVRQFPNIKAINFGTGESLFAPDLIKIIFFLKNKKIKLALTTNGTTINGLSDAVFKNFRDVDISIDFPLAKKHDKWRGKGGLFRDAIAGIVRCKKLKINTSIVMALMNHNFKYLAGFKRLMDKYKVMLRLNLYKPVDTKEYLLSYEQFWSAMKIIAKNFEVVSCSEPLLSWYFPNVKINGSPCGHSVRIHPNKEITPCVYLSIPQKNEFFRYVDKIPAFCQKCTIKERCRGGCLGRRLVESRLDRPDEYCPLYKNKKFPGIKFKVGHNQELIHSAYLCTMILK